MAAGRFFHKIRLARVGKTTALVQMPGCGVVRIDLEADAGGLPLPGKPIGLLHEGLGQALLDILPKRAGGKALCRPTARQWTISANLA